MVQVLPYVPTFGEKLADTVANATGQLAEGYAARQANIKGQAAIKVLNDPNSTPMQKFTASLELPESLRKHSGQALAALIGPGAEAEAQLNQIGQFKNMLGGGAPMQGQTQGQPQPTQQPRDMLGPRQVNAMPPPNANQMMNMANPQGQPVQQPQDNMPQPMAQTQPQGQPAFNPDDVRTWPEEALQMARSLKGPYGDVARTESERRQKEIERQLKEEADIRAENRAVGNQKAKTFFDKVENDRNKINEEETSIDTIIHAIDGGDIDPFSQSHLSEIATALGVPEELTRSWQTLGAKEFKTAQKTFLGNTIKDSFRGTTNQAELRLVDEMLAQQGVSREGNLAAAWGIKAGTELKKKRIEISDRLEAEGYPPAKIPALASRELEPYRKLVKDEYFEALESLRQQGKNGK